jgi:hypothetical protein
MATRFWRWGAGIFRSAKAARGHDKTLAEHDAA